MRVHIHTHTHARALESEAMDTQPHPQEVWRGRQAPHAEAHAALDSLYTDCGDAEGEHRGNDYCAHYPHC